MPDGENRVTVSTYVPAKQRERWAEDAERLGMSQSEFVRTMVQAGRRGFSIDPESGRAPEAGDGGVDPQGNGLRTPVLDVLRDQGPLSWDGLVDALVGDLESDLEEALTELRDDGRIHHSPRTGEYALEEAGDGE